MIMNQQAGTKNSQKQIASALSAKLPSVFRPGASRLMKGMKLSFLALVLAFLTTSFAHAQLSTADILGTVTDASGAVVPNANVVLTDNATNQKRTTTTNGSGDYNFTLLPISHYSISVKAKGFQASNTSDLSVEAGDRARNDVHLQAGAEDTVVEVTASTPLLQADSATVSSTVTARSVQDLPLNGRNFVQLVQIVPGANEGPGNGLTSGGRPDDRRVTASFSVNGQDDTLNNYTIDGIDDNERIIGSIGVRPVVEAIQEITVQTNSYSPEAGRTAGGVVSIITKTGTNAFHGTAYEFFRNNIFDARNVLQTTGNKPELRFNQFGGSIGGPIIKNKTFFFGDYEGSRLVSGVTYTKTVPTIAEYNDIHSLNGGSPQDLVQQGNGTQGLPIDPVSLAYLKLYPKPTNTNLNNNSVISPSKTQFSNSFDIRIDHNLNSHNLFFARYDYNKVNTFTPPGLGTDPTTGLQVSGGQFDFDGPATDTSQQYGLGYTHIFTQNLLLDARAAYTRINNLSLPLNYGTNAAGTVGFPANTINYTASANYLTPIGFASFSDIGDGSFVPLQDIDGTYQYLANLSWTKGNHNIKLGASFIRRQARNTQSPYAAGQFSFGLITDTASNQLQTQTNQLASILVGAFSGDQRIVDITPPDYRTYEPSGFVLDSWKVRSNLTVLYGVRYDVFTPFTEAHNRISNFDFIAALGDTPATVNSALQIANVNGVDGHAGIKTDYSNVAPRVGFSYSLRPETVVRGGYGLSFFPGNYTSNTDLKNAPFISTYSPNCQSSLAIQIEKRANGGTLPGGVNQDCANVPGATTAFDQGLPVPSAPNVSNLSNLSALSFNTEQVNFKSALIQQFNLQVEQQVGANVITIGYVGNIGQHLPQVINDINQPAPFNPRNGAAVRRLAGVLPNLNGVGRVQSEGVSNYNALQTSFQRRFTKGLAFDANYTWAKELGDITGYSQEGDQEGFSDANPFQLRQTEYGIGENDIQNRFALSLNYELQYGKEFTGLKRLALHGYQFNTIAVWQSGKPFTILNGGGNNGAGNNDTTSYVNGNGQTVVENFGNRAVPNDNGGRDRPNQIGNPHGPKTNAQFFNTAAFAPQPVGTVGNVERNSLFGPDFRHVDVSLFKDFAVTERINLQFRAEAYNISNTPSFIIPLGSGNAQLGNSAFGTITNFDPNYNPRQYQFALKAQF